MKIDSPPKRPAATSPLRGRHQRPGVAGSAVAACEDTSAFVTQFA